MKSRWWGSASLFFTLSNALVLLLILGCAGSKPMSKKQEKTPPAKVPSRVKIGLENYLAHPEKYPLPEGPVGLFTNQTGITSDFKLNYQELARLVPLRVVFTPEHGLFGAEAAGARVEDTVEIGHQLSVVSTYGLSVEKLRQELDTLAAVFFDIQDIGIRAYTYISSLAYLMRAAADTGTLVVVLDRPNPINGVQVEGPVVEDSLLSFVGIYPIPYRHGLTIGELAHLFNREFGINCKLQVVPMSNWRRDMWFDETGLPWVPTSPHVPHPSTVLPMITTGIIGELGVISEGVGTTLPFEYIGGPWIKNPDQFAAVLNARHLPGVYFRPAFFKSYYGRFKGRLSGGVQIHITDRERFKPFLTGLEILATHLELYPEIDIFQTPERNLAFDRVTGHTWIREGLQKGLDGTDLADRWQEELTRFKEIRKKYLLYQD